MINFGGEKVKGKDYRRLKLDWDFGGFALAEELDPFGRVA